MLGDLFALLRHYFAAYGYWTLVVTLLLENAGLPLPGETVLLFASFLAYSQRELHLGLIILFGTLACTLGDNLGYWIGHHGGRPLLDRYQHFFRIPPKTIARGERLFARHGAKTVFVARFIFGMRIITGPLAGVLRMPWKEFVLFNFLGAVLWVTTIASVGFIFGRHWQRLYHLMRDANIVIFVAFAVVVLLLWLHYRRQPEGA